MTCEEVRIALGAHALGALDEEEALEVDHHLATCEACGAELAELAGVTAFLGKVSERDVRLVASPPRQVLDRLLNERVKRTRRGRALLAVASAAAVLVVGGTVWTATRTGGETAAQAPAASQQDAPQVMREQGGESAELTRPEPMRTGPEARDFAPSKSPAAEGSPAESPRAQAEPPPSKRKAAEGREFTGANKAAGYRARVLTWPADPGTELGVRVTGVPPDTACRLVVVGRDGRREPTESWVVSRDDYQDKAVFRRRTSMPLDEIDRFEIVDRSGRTLVKVPVADRG
ncbi:anti-sigma factor family protein [Nonomuraea candida]|uniref:anti-sigma factor family protein n=1 Tax=Nonomuraea candida TaxID=359159 RepID=UPI0005B96FFD|nr:zf-HC2 domain-containing protein [Nonomuraea candida]